MQAPVISGTVAGQSIPSGKTDLPFSKVNITDPNIDTSDSLSIQITGGGGRLSDGAGFNGLTRGALGVYILSGTAAAITSELDALVFTPNAFSETTTLTLTDTTSVGKSASDANTTVTVTNGKPVYSMSYFLANQGTLDQIPGAFNILDSAANITANLDKLHNSHLHAIAISDNGNVGASIQQLTTNATAIGKLQNANHSHVRLAITDTTADIQAGLSTLVQDAGEIASITASDGPIVVSAATFVADADRSALDKIAGGFDISDTAVNVEADAGVQLDGRGWANRFVHSQRRRTRAAQAGGGRRLDQRLRHGRSRNERHDRDRQKQGLHRLHRERQAHLGNPGVPGPEHWKHRPTLIGNYDPAHFVHQHQANGSMLIIYTGVSGFDSLQLSAGSAHGNWGAGASWDGSVGHGPGPS